MVGPMPESRATTSPYRIEVPPEGGASRRGVCLVDGCGYVTSRKGSYQKAQAAVADHVKAKHEEQQ